MNNIANKKTRQNYKKQHKIHSFFFNIHFFAYWFYIKTLAFFAQRRYEQSKDMQISVFSLRK